MSKRDSVHTTPNGRGGWQNTSGGRVLNEHRTKDTAMEAGRAVAKTMGTEHVEHGKNGQIKGSNSYGKDPFPPRDKR